ncbi:hypothetical protein K502DRAFT_320067 [Neoconidiobolus thromboides FSU 785]|nr:hypothetical protein K502DRAFT_320067 [Neoconidiobolus thromboides FSU 785]
MDLLSEYLYHEKQDGLLCAQHCLNSLLQNQTFSAVDLSEIAQRLDNEEKKILYTSNFTSKNMDDTGYFSSQVIEEALKIFSMELINIDSDNPKAIKAKKDPSKQKAFICNYESHWFTLRKFGKNNNHSMWYNLDSKLNKPKQLSFTYLDAYLSQLRIEGYTIFIPSYINDPERQLEPCEADAIIDIL